jgi:sulfate adenylyltransferase subunit 2
MSWRDQHIRLRILESEAIYIFREAAAEFRKPVLLYSIGKDSTVLLHLAQKAFAPARLPFPLLHIDTKWKFREMIAFRDTIAAKSGLDLLVYRSRRTDDMALWERLRAPIPVPLRPNER